MITTYKSLVMECDSPFGCNKKGTYFAKTNNVLVLLALAKRDGWEQVSATTCRCSDCSKYGV